MKYQIKECDGMERCISEVKIYRKGKVVHRCSREEADKWVQMTIEDERALNN